MWTNAARAGALALLVAAHARAGTVHFDPPSAVITPGTASVSFEVSVSWETIPTIDTVNVIVLAPEQSQPSFSLAQSFEDVAGPPPISYEVDLLCSAVGAACDDLGLGGNNFTPKAWTSPLLIGTLTLGTSGLSAGSSLAVTIDPMFEASLLGSAASLVASGVNQETLSGMATITVVPEPGMVALMVGAALVVGARGLRRKRNPQPRWG